MYEFDKPKFIKSDFDKTIYKSDKIDKPVEIKEKKEIIPIDEKVESVEEEMMRRQEEKEERVSEDYKKALYGNPPPLSDEESRYKRWRNGRSYKP
jgi:hypothetical protein